MSICVLFVLFVNLFLFVANAFVFSVKTRGYFKAHLTHQNRNIIIIIILIILIIIIIIIIILNLLASRE